MNNDIIQIKNFIPEKYQQKAIKKLKKGYPVQYLIGNVDFYNINVLVNKNVLIPRFETEYLVEKTIKLAKKIKNLRVLDIGTGSGCIAIAIKKNIDCDIDAIDISKKALKIAQKNAKKNNVEVNFFHDNIIDSKINDNYNLIIANPPYVPYYEKVDPKTKYEPQNAIYAIEDGLFFYKVIIEFASKHLSKKGIIAMEIGHNQGEKVLEIAKSFFPKSKSYYENDFNNLNRYFFIINE